jgi:hypothetical protein
MLKTLKDHELAKLILLAALIFGGWLRFLPVQQAGFPVNDGGMFYSMIEDLYANHFLLPQYTTYNLSNIPFAYPPLGFYLGALLKALGLETIQTLIFLPPILSTLAILAFFVFAYQFFKENWLHAALATLSFALIPRSYSWFVMGGGLTRSLGQLFLLLFLAGLLRSYHAPTPRQLLLTGILGSLAILSHPEISIHAFAASVIFWWFHSKTRQGFIHSIAIGSISIGIASLWWGTVLWQHGITPFINALQTGIHSNIVERLINIIPFTFAEEPFVAIVTALGMIGMAYQITNKNYFLSVWLLVHFIAQPRSAEAIAIYPLSLLCALAIREVIFPMITHGKDIKNGVSIEQTQKKRTIVLTAVFAIYLLLGGHHYSTGLSRYYLSHDERQAMEWVTKNTQEESRFLVLAVSENVMANYAAEWFPALAKRHSPLTLQGSEWTQGREFYENFLLWNKLGHCLHISFDCAQTILLTENINFDYIYIAQPVRAYFDDGNDTLPIITDLKKSNQFKLVFENKMVFIFAPSR